MTRRDRVRLQVPADLAYVSTLRTLTAGLAVRCDLTLDQIEDLRLAVDEACALLLPHARPDSQLTAGYTLAPGALEFTASVSALPGSEPDRQAFAWTVLNALAEQLHVYVADGHLTIVLSKQRVALPR